MNHKIDTQEKSEKVLIIGNLGYVGPVLAKKLKSIKPTPYVIGMDTGFFDGCLVDPCITFDRYLDEQIYCDVRSLEGISIPQVDTVFYLAAISNDPMGNVFTTPTDEINSKAAVRLAEEFKKRGAKGFIFASSCSVYGAGGDSPKSESDALNPLTAYSQSKLEAESSLRKVATKEFLITCLRFATACGASPRLRLDLVLNDFVASAILQIRIDILSNGMSWRPLIDIEDMCEAFIWAKDRDSEELFLTTNVGSNSWNYRIIDLANAVSRFVKGVEVRINKDAPADKRSYRVDFSKYETLRENRHSFKSLEETVHELINCLSSSRCMARDFRSSHFIRLKVLEELKDRGLIDESLYWADQDGEISSGLT